MPPPPAHDKIEPMVFVKDSKKSLLFEGKRIAGNRLIAPDDHTKTQISLSITKQVIGSFRMCVDQTGSIESVLPSKSRVILAPRRHRPLASVVARRLGTLVHSRVLDPKSRALVLDDSLDISAVASARAAERSHWRKPDARLTLDVAEGVVAFVANRRRGRESSAESLGEDVGGSRRRRQWPVAVDASVIGCHGTASPCGSDIGCGHRTIEGACSNRRGEELLKAITQEMQRLLGVPERDYFHAIESR